MKPFVFATVTVAALAASTPPAVADADAGAAAFSRGDYAEAKSELIPAARDGDADSQYFLGRMYASGLGVKRDREKAVDLYIAAAEQGHAIAQHDLAYALFMGEGVDQNLVEALKWFIIAGSGGVKKSAALAARVMQILPRDVVHEARSEAHTWIKNNRANESTRIE